MTHADLVLRAERWLRGTKHCGVVLTERRCGGAREEPDVIGWRASFWSILVECKATRSDFLKDRKKVFRLDPVSGMGQQRWFMALPGVVKDVAELPEGWGLIEIRGSRAKVIREATQIGYNFHAARHELALLYSVVRRVQLGVEPTFGIALGDAKLSDAEREAVRTARDVLAKSLASLPR